MERRERSYTCWWDYKLVQPLWETVWRFLKKLRTELPYDPGIPLLGIYLKNTKTLIGKDICTPRFTAALFTIVKIRKQPNCPWMDEWIKKDVVYIHNGMLLSHKEEWNPVICNNMDEPWRYYAKWNKSEVERQMPYDFTHIGIDIYTLLLLCIK